MTLIMGIQPHVTLHGKPKMAYAILDTETAEIESGTRHLLNFSNTGYGTVVYDESPVDPPCFPFDKVLERTDPEYIIVYRETNPHLPPEYKLFPTRYQGDPDTPFPVLQEWINGSFLKFQEFIDSTMGMRIQITDEEIAHAYGASDESLKTAFKNATEYLDIPDPFENFALGLCFAHVAHQKRVKAEAEAETKEKIAKLKSEREAASERRKQEAEREAEAIAETRRKLGLE